MNSIFKDAKLGFVSMQPEKGQAVNTVLSEKDFATARSEIHTWEGYEPTPLVSLAGMAKKLELGEIYYKDEGPRFGLGSFKALGGAYAGLRVLARVLSEELGREFALNELPRSQHKAAIASITLCSATDGNHGKSLAWGAARAGCPCRIYIHADVSEGRAEALREHGAQVIRISGDYDDSVHLAKNEAEANGWFVVSDTSWPGYEAPPRDVMAGYGVLIDEIADSLSAPPTHVFVQGGVGGLAAAVFARLSQIYGANAPRMIVVEPELTACLFASANAGKMQNVRIEKETLMGGLSCGEPSAMAWQILRETARDYMTIPDNLVKPTLAALSKPAAGDAPIAAGESAIAGLAALIAIAQHPAQMAALGLTAGSRVLLIGSEGITDPETHAFVMGQ